MLALGKKGKKKRSPRRKKRFGQKFKMNLIGLMDRRLEFNMPLEPNIKEHIPPMFKKRMAGIGKKEAIFRNLILLKEHAKQPRGDSQQ